MRKNTSKRQDGEPKQTALSSMYDKLMAYAKVIEGSDWIKGWASTQHTWHGFPQNISGRQYTGGNSFYLMMATMANNHTVPIYATFNQIQKMNEHLMDERGRIPKEKWAEAVHIKKGEQSEIVVFNTPIYVNADKPKEKPLSAKEYEKLPKEEKEKYNQIWAQVPHVIFNIDQTNMREVRPELYEKLVERMMPKQKQTFRMDTMGMYEEPAIDHILRNQAWRCPIAFDKESKSAFYSPSKDTITVPMKEQFNIPYTENELDRDILRHVTPGLSLKPAITDFSDADRQMSRVEENIKNKEYLTELRATIMLENAFGRQLGMLRQDGQSLYDYASQVSTAINNDREAIIAIKDAEAKIIGGQDYYSTFLHEGAHSMYMELNIELNATGDKRGYAREEMRVESSTAMVASAMGYSTNMFINSAAYVRGWNETANIQEKTRAMQQLISDINKTVNRMGEIIDDARLKVGQEPIFKRSTAADKTEQQPDQQASQAAQQQPKGEAIPSPIAPTDLQSVGQRDGDLQSPSQSAQNGPTQQPKAEEIPSPIATDQKADHTNHTNQAPADSQSAGQETGKPGYDIPDAPPIDRVAEDLPQHQPEFSVWDKLSALLMDTSEDIHLRAKEDDILVLETDEDMGLSDLEKNHLAEVWQHPSEGIITFKMEGSNQEYDLSDYPEFIPQVYDHVLEGNMETISVRQELENKIIALSELAARTQKDRPSDIVFVREFNPDTWGNTYTAYGKDADRLAEKVSSSVAAMRPEIDGQRFSHATVNSGNIDVVRADMMAGNVRPVIIDTRGERITNDNKLDYSKEDRKVFLDALKPEAQQLKNINETLQRMGFPDNIAVPQAYEHPSARPELVIPHRFGYQEVALMEIKKAKDGSYRAGNSEEGFHPIAKMDTNNLYQVERALRNAELLLPQNLVKELLSQVRADKVEMDRDYAGGRYIAIINDPEGRNGTYPRGFKQFTFGPDLKDEVLLRDDWNNRHTAIKVDPITVQQLVSYAESKLGTALSMGQTPQSPSHRIDDFFIRNVNGDWRLSANIDGKRMPEISIPHEDVVAYKHGRMTQEEITLKSYGDMLSDKQQQSHHKGRGMH